MGEELYKKMETLNDFLKKQLEENKAKTFVTSVPLTAFVDDFQPELDPELSQEDDIELVKDLELVPLKISSAEKVPIAAVDTSLAILGETDRGVGVAFRSAIVVEDRPKLRATYIAHLTTQNKDLIYKTLRKDYLGEDVKGTPVLTWLPNRVANLIERIAQRLASCLISDGIVLWDGSLTVTMETTKDLLRRSIEIAHKQGNSIIAVSKSSRLRLKDGTKLTHLLANRREPCLVHIEQSMLASQCNVMGKIHVVKFTSDGFSFRVDVAPRPNLNCCELIKKVLSSCDFERGYPAPLAQAHAQAYFTRSEVLELQAEFIRMCRPALLEGFDIRRHVLGVFGL